MENVTFVPSMQPQTACAFPCVASLPTPVNISFELLFNGMVADPSDVITTGLSSTSFNANASVHNITRNSSGVFICMFEIACGNASIDYTLIVGKFEVDGYVQ